MAFTASQKEQIKARAKQLVDAGMAEGPAAQQAARELFAAQPEIRQQFETPQPATTVSPEFPVAEREAERQEQLREIAQLQESPKVGSVETAEQAYRAARASQLKIENPNLSDAAAAAIAQREVAEEFKQPVPFGYGAPEERAEEGVGVRALEAAATNIPRIISDVPVIGPVAEGVAGGLERQVEEVVPFTQREEEVVGQPGVGVDWNRIQQKFVEDLQIPEDEVAADVDSFKQNFYRPALQSARDKGLEGTEAVQAALDTAFQEFADMGRRLQDKESYIKDEPTIRGPADRWFETFSQKENIGEGIPDLTPAQRAYLSDRESRAIEAEVARRMATKPTTDLYSGDFRLKTEKEVRDEVKQEMETWWLQEDFQERINRPDIYTDYGILQDVSPLGTTKETVSGWLLRSAMAPWGIVPALISEAVFPGEESTEYDVVDRILTNVAESRGFMGEGEAIMKERGITAETAPYQYYGGMTLGFALDLLDPSIDAIKAGGAVFGGAGRYGYNTGKLYGRLGSEDLSEALAFGFNKGRESFYNDYIISNLVGARYDAGSVMNVASNRMRKDIDAAIQAEDILRATPNATVDDALSQLSNYKGTAYYNNLATRSGQPLSDAVKGARDIIKTSDNVLERAGNISRDLERMAQGSQPRTLTNGDVARVVRSLAMLNTDIVKAYKANGIKGILANAGTRNIFRQGIAADEAMRAVAKSTRGNFLRATDIDNIVALTDNTYAGRRAAEEIIKRVKKSSPGKLITGLNPENLKLVVHNSRSAGQGAVVPAYDLSTEPGKLRNLLTHIKALEDIGAINARRAQGIAASVRKQRALTVEDSRYILDKLTDVMAEAVALDKPSSIMRATDIAQMTPQRQMELLEPLERRTFATRELRALYRDLRGDKPIELFAGPAQRNMLKRAAVEGEAIVSRLGSRLQDLINKPDVREVYGIDAKAKLTPADALQHLIVGPGFHDKTATLKSSLTDALMSNFQTNTTFENLFDTIAGTNVTSNTSVLSGKLIKTLDESVEEAAERIMTRGSTTYFEELNKLIDQVESLMKSDPELFREPVENITSLREVAGGKLSTDLQIIPYIKAEAARITDRLMSDFVESALDSVGGKELFEAFIEASDSPFIVFNQFSRIGDTAAESIKLPAGGRRQAQPPVETGPAPRGIWRRGGPKKTETPRSTEGTTSYPIKNQTIAALDIVKEGVKLRLQGINLLEEYQFYKRAVEGNEIYLEPADGVEDFLEKVSRGQTGPIQERGMWRRGGERLKGPNAKQVELSLKLADDLINYIMKTNKMAVSDLNVAQLENLLENVIVGRRGSESLKALFGEDVAGQITGEFMSGFSNVRKQLISDLRTGYLYDKTMFKAPGTGGEKLAKVIKRYIDLAQNMRYLTMLNFRPRFHGVNLLTGSEIFYQNLGRAPAMKDILVDAPKILFGGVDSNKVMITTPTGKRYTAGELREILSDATGKSVYRPDLFNTADDLNAVRVLIEKPDEFILTRYGRRYGKGFRDLPQNEDLIFRYSALAQALKEGRSEAEAIELARKSMFDRADITDLERKSIGRAALFYGFARSALATALRNLSSVKGLKRIKNVARTRDYAQDMLLPEGTEERRIADFAPNYAASRIITQVKPIKEEESKYEILTTPGIPTLQSFETFAEILKGNIGEVIAGFISPEYKALLNIQDPFAREYQEVPAEHLAILDSISNVSGFDTTDSTIRLIMRIFGGVPSDIVPTPRRNPDGSISMSYQFSTPSQKKAYSKFMTTIGILGLSTVAQDFGRIATDEPVRGTQFDTDLTGGGQFRQFYGIDNLPEIPFPFIGSIRSIPDIRQDVGGFTPMSTYTPEKQAYFDRLGRMKAIQAAANELASAQADRIEALFPPSPEQQRIQETIERGQEKKEEALRQMSPERRGTIRTAEEIRRERDMLMNRDAARQLLEDQRQRLREQRPPKPQRPQ